MLQNRKILPLSRAFFDRSALVVAPDLLGRLLVRTDARADGSLIVRAGRVVETEAYMQDDPAFHAWGIVDVPTGLVRPSGRGYDLFAPPGTSYVYLCYGIHWLLNVVTEREGVAGCVLIRAVEPVAGLDAMFVQREAARSERDLCNGPGKLCQAFEIDGRHHRTNLCHGDIVFADDESRTDRTIATSSRVGISRAIENKWRFYYEGDPFVSPGVPSDIAVARRAASRRSRRATRRGH